MSSFSPIKRQRTSAACRETVWVRESGEIEFGWWCGVYRAGDFLFRWFASLGFSPGVEPDYSGLSRLIG